MQFLFSRDDAERRMNEEFGFHVEMETERLVRDAGLDPREARRRARAAFGGVDTLYTYPPFAEDRQRKLLSQ